MPGSLTEAQVEHFRREGYAFPFDAIGSEEAAACIARLDSYDAILGEECQKQLKIKAHVAAPWIVELARNPKILDAVEIDHRAEHLAVRRIDVLQEGAR